MINMLRHPPDEITDLGLLAKALSTLQEHEKDGEVWGIFQLQLHYGGTCVFRPINQMHLLTGPDCRIILPYYTTDYVMQRIQQLTKG